jgi:hypothetical protein
MDKKTLQSKMNKNVYELPFNVGTIMYVISGVESSRKKRGEVLIGGYRISSELKVQRWDITHINVATSEELPESLIDLRLEKENVNIPLSLALSDAKKIDVAALIFERYIFSTSANTLVDYVKRLLSEETCETLSTTSK